MGFVYANLIGIFELRSAMNNSKNKLLIHTLVILGIMLPLQHAVSAELDFVKEGDAVYKPGHPIYDRWDKFNVRDLPFPPIPLGTLTILMHG